MRSEQALLHMRSACRVCMGNKGWVTRRADIIDEEKSFGCNPRAFQQCLETLEARAQCCKRQTPAQTKKLLVAQVVCTRGICTPLRPAIPPLKAPLSFACSVASLSRSPGHYQPGHHSFRRVAPAECHLGWDKPSTCSAARSTVPNTAAATPHAGDREP